MADSSTRHRSFAWLNITQFFGALNDNVFRWLVVYFLLDLPENAGKTHIIPLVTFIFILPFLLFSHAAGVLADRYSKRSIIVFSKLLELLIMVIGCAGMLYANPTLLYIVVFLMCTQSTIFGPSKYGIVPELLRKEELSKANGYLTGLTYLAIIIGTFIPTYILREILSKNYMAVALFSLLIAVLGLLACVNIEKTPAAGTGKKFSALFFVKIFKTLKNTMDDNELFLAIMGSVYFLFLGGLIQQNLIIYGMQTLQLESMEAGYLFPAAAFGIGIGALLAGKFSGRNIEFGIVPVGALILTVCCILIHFADPGAPGPGLSFLEFLKHISGLLGIIFVLGIGSGLFIVPLTAYIQYKSPPDQLGEILACNNFFSMLGVALSAAILWLLTSILNVSANYCFIISGVFTGLLAILAIRVLPDFLVRFVIIFFAKFFYRINVRGLENIPVNGPALLVSNHVTWVDTLLINAYVQRRIRYIMSRDVYETIWIKPLLRLMKVITISPSDPPRQIAKSIKNARAALDDGFLVCIFAEGTLTRNGNIREFRPGVEHILKNTHHPVIPIHLGGAWGSIFSHYYGKLMSHLPRQIPYHVSVIFGRPMPPSSTTAEIRQAITELSCQSYDMKKGPKRNLAHKFVKTARKRWHHKAISDSTGKSLSFANTLTGALALGAKIRQIDPDTEKIGVLLPSSVGGALTNLAVTLQGRVPVNLNFTASDTSIESALKQCEIKTIITSRAFIEKLDGYKPPEEQTRYLEDISASISGADKLSARIKAHCASVSSMTYFRHPGPDDLATIIFSSGSTGEPKGVMLSHHNILSNVEAINEVFQFMTSDRMCGILPFFHSFGFMATLWCPLTIGFSSFYHPNPIDGTGIAKIVRENRLTVLLATPTFLLAYIRRAKREDFESLRVVVVGAEKLKKKVADTFEEQFGIRPMEGYGATELSPVVSLNLENVEIDNVVQIGHKEGSIGHPVPGVSVKIVDTDTGRTLPYETEGLVMVKGPNVMLGYLNNPEKTGEVLKDGWYNTGDIGKMDSDGFVFLLDRLSRYSKIGGEMVPHIAVEDKLMEALGAVSPVVFVTAAPDEKKGEQLVVLYTPEAGDVQKLVHVIKESDLPNLWKPKKDNFFELEALPTLGSGKLDLKKLKAIASEYALNKPGIVQKTINKIRDSI